MPLSRDEKREKFIKHGNRRLMNAVKNIKLIKNIANNNYYDYGDKDIKLIFSKKAVKYINMADVFILSSKYEGLPNVLLEAACLNKYIIASNCKTGPSEILKQYQYGELYDPGNIKQLSHKLKKLQKNYLKNKKRNAQKLKLFDFNNNLKKYLKLIEKLN